MILVILILVFAFFFIIISYSCCLLSFHYPFNFIVEIKIVFKFTSLFWISFPSNNSWFLKSLEHFPRTRHIKDSFFLYTNFEIAFSFVGGFNFKAQPKFTCNPCYNTKYLEGQRGKLAGCWCFGKMFHLFLLFQWFY